VSRHGVSGRRFVVGLYALLVAIAGAAGYLTATFVPEVERPAFLFLIELPATPIGFTVYGALTVALVLGVPLLLVSYVSREIDDVEAEP
jgi:hypothetical protein